MNECVDKCSNCGDFSWTIFDGLCKICRRAPQRLSPLQISFSPLMYHKSQKPVKQLTRSFMKKECAKGHPWVVGNIIVDGKKTRCKTCRVASTKAASEARKAKGAIKVTA